jgi:hypothetical protein
MTEQDQARTDWLALDQGMKTWNWGQRKWLIKHLSGFSATGRVMKRRKEWTHDHCPWCDAPNENADHLYNCASPLAAKARTLALATYWETQESIGTSPLILKSLRTILSCWPAPAPTVYCTTCPEVETSINEQYEIGWLPFLWGRISHKWRLAQDRWLQRIATRYKKSVNIWAAKFVRSNALIGWTLWEQRNAYLHSDEHPWKLGPRNDRMTTIRQLFQAYTPTALPVVDQRWFTHYTVASLSESPSYIQIQWLESVNWAYQKLTLP